jgi:hypothetical protein
MRLLTKFAYLIGWKTCYWVGYQYPVKSGLYVGDMSVTVRPWITRENMGDMLISAFSTFTPDVKTGTPPTSQEPAPAARPMTDAQAYEIAGRVSTCVEAIREAEKSHRISSQPTAPAVPAGEAYFVSQERVIDEYLSDYEMIGETEDGRDACYTPTDGDRALIKDAIMGLLSTDEWAALSAAPAAVPAVPEGMRMMPVEPDEMWAYRVIRHHQPNLEVGCKDWLKELETMLHWHAAMLGIASAPTSTKGGV